MMTIIKSFFCGLRRFFAVLCLKLFWPFFIRYQIHYKFPFIRLRRIPFIFVVYPGTDTDVRSYFPNFLPIFLIKIIRKFLGTVFPIGKLGAGFVMATFYTVDQIEDSGEVAKIFHDSLLNIKKLTGAKIAVAGRMPGVLIKHGFTEEIFVNGSMGTVHACVQAFLNLLSRREKIYEKLTVGVVGAAGFVGSRLIDRLITLGFERIYGFDPRYESESECGESVFTNEVRKVEKCDVVIVLSARGSDFLQYVEYVKSGCFVLDDTHPQMDSFIVQELLQRDVHVYKVALSLEDMSFSPPIPGYKKDWLPGCVWEALVIASAEMYGLDLDGIQNDYEKFLFVASVLKFSPVLAYHFFGNYSA